MSNGRTVWWAKDAAHYDRERTVELGEEFGPAGPVVVDWLSCQAKQQNDGPREAPTGMVKSGFRAVARGAFLEDAGEARRIVEFAHEIGALDDLEIAEDGRTFICRISGWTTEQGRAAETDRKRRQRGTSRDEPGHEPPAPAGTAGDDPGQAAPVSPDVPECPPTGQDRTGEKAAAAARERATPPGEPVVHPQLDEVVEILTDESLSWPLDVEPMSVDRVLRANVDLDAVAAAQTVASWANDPEQLDCRVANRLLGRAFQHLERRQAQVRDIRAGTRRHTRGETHDERVARLKAEAAAAHAAENRQEAHP